MLYKNMIRQREKNVATLRSIIYSGSKEKKAKVINLFV